MTFILQLPRATCRTSKPFVKKINSGITRQVTELHNKGFCFDFCITAENGIFCIQNNREYRTEQLTVELVNQGFDEMNGYYQYIHKVETESGEKGIMMLQTIYFNPVC